MKIHVFTASKDASFGFSTSEAGQNLPAQYGPWMHFKMIDVHSFEEHRIGVDLEALLHGLKEQGYYILK